MKSSFIHTLVHMLQCRKPFIIKDASNAPSVGLSRFSSHQSTYCKTRCDTKCFPTRPDVQKEEKHSLKTRVKRKRYHKEPSTPGTATTKTRLQKPPQPKRPEEPTPQPWGCDPDSSVHLSRRNLSNSIPTVTTIFTNPDMDGPEVNQPRLLHRKKRDEEVNRLQL